MKQIYILLLTLNICACVAVAATPAQMVFDACNTFSAVKNFKSTIDIHFDIPSINISEMKGKVFYSAPDKFKIRLTGVAFLPKQSPFELFNFLKDTTGYIAVSTGTEKVQGSNCAILSVIPRIEQDIVIEKVWINTVSRVIVRSEVTSKSKGTVKADYYYDGNISYPLPSKIVFSIDLTKFKLPKVISVDINSTSKGSKGKEEEKGTIVFDFKEYVVNKGV